MVCLRNICINTLHTGDNGDDDDNNDNNKTTAYISDPRDTCIIIIIIIIIIIVLFFCEELTNSVGIFYLLKMSDIHYVSLL